MAHYYPPSHPLILSTTTSRTTIRVCMDKDCKLDGSDDALAILSQLAPKSAEVTTCGCLGPCGGGPNVEVKDEMGKVRASGELF